VVCSGQHHFLHRLHRCSQRADLLLRSVRGELCGFWTIFGRI